MAYQLSTKRFNYWKRLMKRMLEAHKKSGVPLRDDLNKALQKANDTFVALVNSYIDYRGQERQARNEAARLQIDSQKILRKTKHALMGKVAKDQIEVIVQVYGLDRDLPKSRNEVLNGLSTVLEAIGQQSDESRVPPEHIKTKLQSVHAALYSKVEEINGILAHIEEIRRQLQQALLENAVLRERIYSYLVGELPGGTQDPRLIDYGLRQSFGYGKGSGRTPVVVKDEDMQPQPEPEPTG